MCYGQEQATHVSFVSKQFSSQTIDNLKAAAELDNSNKVLV